MSSPFEALLRYAFVGDASEVQVFVDLVDRRVRAARVADAEDVRQGVLYKMVLGSERTLLRVRSLAKSNPRLAAALDEGPTGAIPSVPPDVLAEADRQLEAYVAKSISNAMKDGLRRGRRVEPLPDPEAVADAVPLLDDRDDVPALRDRVLSEVRRDPKCPAGFDATFGEVESLAEATLTMDELTAACVAGDPELARLEPAAARSRARNRLQQRHQRARDAVLAKAKALVAAGALTPDEGWVVGSWMQLLKRRQNETGAASLGSGR